jgi:membrane protease YdiL (CAAX protease family)
VTGPGRGPTAGVAAVVLLAWMLVTFVVGRARTPASGDIAAAVASGIGWQFLAAGLLLLALALGRGWRGIGLGAPEAGSLRLAWLPVLYIAVMLALLMALGLPPGQTVAIVGINAAMVGFSEELMFRGVLFAGLRDRLAVWPAIWLATAAFGAVHMLNALSTGDPGAAALQAVAAGLSGLWFMALRLRTGSIWPGAVLHAAWDGALILLVVAAGGVGEGPVQVSPAALLVPVLLVVPLAGYGLFLLRRVS